MSNRASLNILVVDDEKVVRDFLVRFLDLEGIKAKEAGDGFEAIKMAGKERFDVIFVELRMPGMDGVTALTELKKISPMTKYVMMSGNDVQNRMEEARRQGVYLCMKKPFDIDELKALIDKFRSD
ncbi:MAG: response regulator [Candidatus Omnitrophota bacterium]